jgi:hypothetical protein
MDKIGMLHRSLWLTVINTALEDYRSKKLDRDYFSSPYFCRVICSDGRRKAGGREKGTVMAGNTIGEVNINLPHEPC